MSAVGIDLGTSNTVVALARPGEATLALADAEGRTLIPSVISFHPSGTVLVGEPAKERRFVDTRNTFAGLKRLIGRAWWSPEVQDARRRVPFELRPGPNQSVQVMARNELYTLPEMSAFVLRKARKVAEEATGQSITRAVVTVPANFNDLQREATKLAAKLAGLEVLRILNEPTAAALAYGIETRNAERVLVYDFGGGTFDVTLMEVTGGVFRVRATAGDMFLGGDDLDLAIAERMAAAFLKRHYYDLRSSKDVYARVVVAAEELKMKLGEAREATVSLEDLVHGPGGKSLGFDFVLTRAELEGIARPMVDRTIAICREAMARASWSPADLDAIVLVGGTTRLPLVQETTAGFFKREAAQGINPVEAVALGAAEFARIASDERRAAALASGEGEAERPAASLFDPHALAEERARASERNAASARSSSGEASARSAPATTPTGSEPSPATTPDARPEPSPPVASSRKLPARRGLQATLLWVGAVVLLFAGVAVGLLLQRLDMMRWFAR